VLLNHFLKPSELEQSIQHSKLLTEPVTPILNPDPVLVAEQKKRHEEQHARAAAALARIVSLANANQEEKTRANTRRCIEVFGRHNTDETLRPRPATAMALKGDVKLPEKTPRAGPDTGSSEVQIAILTAKIRVLANQLETKGGSKDKINKRNLRVMVHKRQKLLRYLRSKERGGDRWRHLVETLGLSEGTWKGEISL
jgi:ribosomal protein S15